MTGTLGRAFARLCEARGLHARVTTRQELDIADPASAEQALVAFDPWAVVNTAGYVRVDDAEREPDRCHRENAEGPACLAAACAQRGLPFVTFSSDLVFDGSKREPYVETDPVSPLNVYGRTKAEGEERVLAVAPSSLVIRTSAFFGPWDAYNFVTVALRELGAGREFYAVDDSVVSPTYVPDLVNATLDLLIDGEAGIWHVANEGAVTWAELARMAVEALGVDGSALRVGPTPAELPARRPPYSALGSVRGGLLPPLASALARYAVERDPTL